MDEGDCCELLLGELDGALVADAANAALAMELETALARVTATASALRRMREVANRGSGLPFRGTRLTVFRHEIDAFEALDARIRAKLGPLDPPSDPSPPVSKPTACEPTTIIEVPTEPAPEPPTAEEYDEPIAHMLVIQSAKEKLQDRPPLVIALDDDDDDDESMTADESELEPVDEIPTETSGLSEQSSPMPSKSSHIPDQILPTPEKEQEKTSETPVQVAPKNGVKKRKRKVPSPPSRDGLGSDEKQSSSVSTESSQIPHQTSTTPGTAYKKTRDALVKVAPKNGAKKIPYTLPASGDDLDTEEKRLLSVGRSCLFQCQPMQTDLSLVTFSHLETLTVQVLWVINSVVTVNNVRKTKGLPALEGDILSVTADVASLLLGVLIGYEPVTLTLVHLYRSLYDAVQRRACRELLPPTSVREPSLAPASTIDGRPQHVSNILAGLLPPSVMQELTTSDAIALMWTALVFMVCGKVAYSDEIVDENRIMSWVRLFSAHIKSAPLSKFRADVPLTISYLALAMVVQGTIAFGNKATIGRLTCALLQFNLRSSAEFVYIRGLCQRLWAALTPTLATRVPAVPKFDFKKEFDVILLVVEGRKPEREATKNSLPCATKK